MGTKNQQSSGTSNGTSTTTLAPQVQAAYNALLGQIGGTSTGTNAATNSASTGLGSLSTASNPGYNSAGSTLSAAATPASASIGSYLSPYLTGALQTQIASQNQQNAQQQQSLLGNAAAQGALGGDRIGVAQGQLAGQQDLANNQANSSLINSAYQQAESSALQGQSNETAAGSAQTNLGSSTNASTLSDLLGQLSAGNSQFSNLGTLAGSAGNLSNTGATTTTSGTTSQTQPSGNILSSLLGAGLGIAGLFKSGGVVPNYDAGGMVDQMANERAAGIAQAIQASTPQNDNQANDNSPLGNLASPAQMKAGATNIGSLLSGIGLARGGVAGDSSRGGLVMRHGYDDGGYVTAPDSFYSSLLDQITNQPDQNSAPPPPALSVVPKPSVVPPQSFDVPPPPSFDPNLTAGTLGPQVADASPAVQSTARLVPLAPLPSASVVPTAVASAPNGGLGAVMATDEQAYGLPSGYLSRTAQIESSGNPDAHNASGATGLFQFMPSTAKQYGLTNPYDPVASTDAAAQLAAANEATLAKGLGRQPTPAELYLAHQQGAGGALGLLQNPDAPASSIIGAKAVTQNGGTSGMSASQFAGMWENKYGSGNASPVNTAAHGVIPAAVSSSGAPAGGIPGGLGVTPPGGYGIPDSNSGYSTNIGDVLKSLQAGKGLDLSPDARMGLLSAAAGMMSGTSPNAFGNVGTGIQQGLKTWQDQQAVERENAKANSDIGTQQGNLGISGGQLAVNAGLAGAQIGQENAAAGLTNVQSAVQRYVRTPTAAGLMVYDATQPNTVPHVIPWNQVSSQDLQGITPGGQLPPVAGNSSGAPSPSGAILPSASTPLPAPSIDPRQMNPNTDVQAQPVSLATPVLADAQKEMQGAQTANGQLQELHNDLSTLDQSGGFLTPGAGFNGRLDWANKANTALSAIGMAPMFGPSSVAAGEDANKQTTRLGDALASSMGSREAAQIVMASVGATPGASQTPAGAAHIMSGLEAMNQRKIDYYTKASQWAQQNNGTLSNFDSWFNQNYPPELYAISSYVPQQAMVTLRQNPNLAQAFDQKYGNGQQISKYVLGQ